MKQISRAKFENIAYLTMNILNVAVYLLILSSSVLKAKDGTLTDIIQTIYCRGKGLMMLLVSHYVWNNFQYNNIHRGIYAWFCIYTLVTRLQYSPTKQLSYSLAKL
ncbi:hypothetical protein BY458DRAFT_303711 [Sporodiniella umbellata]|nr:hypothetical protein BY458DRAFT_303711 [Sporodiniella umbellata]